jgi:hypothetical protein
MVRKLRRGEQSDKRHVLSKEEFEDFLRWKATSVIDKVVDNVLEETTTKVMQEKESSEADDGDMVELQEKAGGVAAMDVEVVLAESQDGME